MGDDELRLAIAHHQAGRLAEAEQLYARVLRRAPDHLQALTYRGVLAHHLGRHDLAEQMLRRAVECGGGADAENNLGEVLRARGKWSEAAACYRRAIALQPNFAEPHSNLGIALVAQNEPEEALTFHRRAVELNPRHPNLQNSLAEALARTGRVDEAIGAWRRALELHPQHGPALENLGTALLRRGDPAQAEPLLRRCVASFPQHARAWTTLAEALSALGRDHQAIEAAQRAVSLLPQRSEPHTVLGMVLQKASQPQAARAALDRAIELDPSYAPAHVKRGALLESQGEYQPAADAFARAAALRPDDPEAHSALSYNLRQLGRLTDALAAAERALALSPQHADAHGNRAMALLHLGDYSEGFREYEWRWHCRAFTDRERESDRPTWDGSDPRGRTILVTAEQGLGDTIQFSRYVPMLAASGARVILECPASLVEIMRTLEGIAQVVPAVGAEPPREFDLQVPLLGLPHRFGTTAATIPNAVPYLRADAARAALWRERIGADDANRGLRVGLVWGGNVVPDARRSAMLDDFAPLAELENVTFFSLQKGEHAEQLKRASTGPRMIDLAPELRDFAETAAALAHLDLLITIDTAAAHLSGALGRPTWVLLPHVADWRWLAGTDASSGWYPTARTFRQPAPGDWESVVRRVKQMLSENPRSD